PGIKYTNPLGTISLMIALVFGTAGLPHILMRFFTVKDAKTARSSVITATWTIGIFYILTLFLGFGAAAYVGEKAILSANHGRYILASLLGQAVRRVLFFTVCIAFSFRTSLADVAGVRLYLLRRNSHDIYGPLFTHPPFT